MTGYAKRIVGLAFWTVLFIAVLFGVYLGTRSREGKVTSPMSQRVASLAAFALGNESTFTRIDPSGRLAKGSPVFLADVTDDETNHVTFRQIGHVIESANEPGGNVRLVWYGRFAESNFDFDAFQLLRYESTGRLSEVVQTMLPADKRDRIEARLKQAMRQHGETLSRSLTPIVEESFRRSLPIIESSFQASVARHRDQIDRLGERWNRNIVQQRLIPMARKEILPIVQKHGRPPAEKIGREIWDRASLFRFGWRALYDKSPLPRKDLLRQEWQRFVDDDAVPILEAHMDEIVVAIQRTVNDVASDPAVRREVAQAANDFAADPETRKLVQAILKETFVDNEELKQLWQEIWTSDEATAALEIASERLEPILREIGDDLFGNEEQGIDPNFARVLRSQILRKDRQWVVAWHTGANNGMIDKADKHLPYPVVYAAETPLDQAGGVDRAGIRRP